ncbi:hypothetical protein ACWDR3_04440 [Streptomyces sp. NPDC001002]
MARFEVRICDEGFAEIDGDPLVPAPGESVHEAVLDELQRRAEECAAVVEATVHDGPGAPHFVLSVSPDGSSSVLVPEPEQAPAPAPAAASAVATAVARARARATTGAVTDVPAELAEQVGRIQESAAAGRLDEAFARATALREELTGSTGASHPCAVEARALEAYLAHLRGDHRQAVVLALAVARIRCGAMDGRAAADVVRAAAAWQQLDDERALIVHGRELLHMWAALDRGGLLPPGDAELAGLVREEVEALAVYA